MKTFLTAIVAVFLIAGLNSCSDDTESTVTPVDFIATQTNLNAAVNEFDIGVTGTKYGPATVAHNGMEDAGVYDTYRDIYTNLSSNDLSNIKKGDIVTKRIYARGSDGTKGDLMVTFAMIKREAGYDSDNGDWEYVMMPASADVNYDDMPNGMIPDAETDMRGKIAMCIGCHKQAADGSGLFIRNEQGEINVTQTDIDQAVSVFEMEITGFKYGDASVAHNGSTLSAEETYRDVYSNWASKSQKITPGTIITKHTFMKNADGTKGDLAVTFAMIKRKPGYWSENGDWEYMMMPASAEIDYAVHPNGMIPTDPSMRGKIEMCAGCHAQAPGNNFLFVRN